MQALGRVRLVITELVKHAAARFEQFPDHLGVCIQARRCGFNRRQPLLGCDVFTRIKPLISERSEHLSVALPLNASSSFPISLGSLDLSLRCIDRGSGLVAKFFQHST